MSYRNVLFIKKKFIIENLKGVNPYLHNYINSDDKYHNLILGSGEEYTPIFTLPKNSRLKLLKNPPVSLKTLLGELSRSS